MNKKIIIIFLAIIFVIAGLIFWKSISRKGGFSTVPTRSFTIAKAWWPVWDTFQIGVNQREETKRSFRTTFIQKEDYVAALNEFIRGKAGAATLTIFEVLLAASEGIPLRIVLLLDYTTGSDGVVAKKSIASLQDLIGKRIGVQKGTIAHFTVLKMLEKAGLNQTEVQLVDLDLEALRQAFLHDRVDAAAIYEPYMSDIANQGNGYVIFSSLEIPRAICDVLFVKEAIARDHPDLIDHWVEAWNDALNFKGSESENYLRTLNRLNGTPIPDLKKSFKGIFFTNLAENRRAFGTAEGAGYLLESLEEMMEFMFQEKIIKKRIPLEDLLDSGGVQRFFEK